jgi:hypothetical protein
MWPTDQILNQLLPPLVDEAKLIAVMATAKIAKSLCSILAELGGLSVHFLSSADEALFHSGFITKPSFHLVCCWWGVTWVSQRGLAMSCI